MYVLPMLFDRQSRLSLWPKGSKVVGNKTRKLKSVCMCAVVVHGNVSIKGWRQCCNICDVSVTSLFIFYSFTPRTPRGMYHVAVLQFYNLANDVRDTL
jgi:hypothetical protein